MVIFHCLYIKNMIYLLFFVDFYVFFFRAFCNDLSSLLQWAIQFLPEPWLNFFYFIPVYLFILSIYTKNPPLMAEEHVKLLILPFQTHFTHKTFSNSIRLNFSCTSNDTLLSHHVFFFNIFFLWNIPRWS